MVICFLTGYSSTFLSCRMVRSLIWQKVRHFSHVLLKCSFMRQTDLQEFSHLILKCLFIRAVRVFTGFTHSVIRFGRNNSSMKLLLLLDLDCQESLRIWNTRSWLQQCLCTLNTLLILLIKAKIINPEKWKIN